MLIIERDGAIATLTLDRPDKRNALSTELRDRISDALDELADDESVRSIVFTGNGPAFCAGFDLDEFARAAEDADFGRELWASSDRFHRTVLSCPVPTVAAVNGAAVAGGFDLAVMCDLRVISEETTFAHPEISFGDVVYGPLHDLVGGGFARELVLTGRRVGASEALHHGLANRVVHADEVLAAALEVAGSIAASPREVSRRTKAKIIRRAAVVGEATLDL